MVAGCGTGAQSAQGTTKGRWGALASEVRCGGWEDIVEQKTQNILMIHMESWDGRMLGGQGDHPAMREATPNIDALAETRPFFLCLNPGLVHAAFRTNEYWLDVIPAEKVDAPPLDETGHPANVYQLKSKGWRNGLDDETVRRVRRIYFAMCAEADAMIGELIDREATLQIWEAYRRHAFAQFQRQAKRGLYWDASYSLRGNPSSDYPTIMNNVFTGWDHEDEARVNRWLRG